MLKMHGQTTLKSCMIDLITLLVWETFMYRKLSPNIKGHVLGICFLYDMFLMLLAFAPLLRRFWLSLYSLNILGSSS